MKNIVLNIKNDSNYIKLYLILVLSLLFFLRKGIQYAFIGSYFPMSIILVVLTFLVWSKSKSLTYHKRIIRLWSILLIIWSLFRILMTLIIWFFKSINESHIYEQLGIIGFSLSLLMLYFGVYLFRNSTKLK